MFPSIAKVRTLVVVLVCVLSALLVLYQSDVFHNKFWKGTYHGPCTLDAMNLLGMDQGSSCVVSIIRQKFLIPPSTKPLNLQYPDVKNPSMGQAQILLKHLQEKRKGFFVECGALDGETRSNTLFMEQELEWEGILIEADPDNFKKVIEKHRKAWAVPACLSTSSYPKIVSFRQNFNQGKISDKRNDGDTRTVNVQCFPFYSILLALNRTTVDYFSLDIEGDELAVLKTIPWNLVDIKTLSVEFIHDEEGKEEIRKFMSRKGYEVITEVTHPMWLANDFIFTKVS